MKQTLRDLRKENKKTAVEVATVLGTTIQSLYRYEQGKRQISLSQVVLLAELYRESIEDIVMAQLASVEVCKSQQIV